MNKNLFFILFLIVGSIGLSSCMEIVPVEPEPITNPDLRAVDIRVNDSTPIPGQDITLSTTIINSGSGSSPATILRWYRSVDAIISTNGDVLEGTNAVAIISAGGDTNESITISAPSSPGSYYYGACLNAVSGESSTVNNCSRVTMIVISNQDFNTLMAEGNTTPTDLWSDGTTMWVADAIDDKIYAYNLSTKARIASQDFNTLPAAGNNSPTGLWSDGTTMWVADNEDDKIYAYNLSNKARIASQDFDTLIAAGNSNSFAIWSDGTTMWVVDGAEGADDKIYAYNLSTKARDASQDFDTLSNAGNNNPTGVWSDGTTMWVVDQLGAGGDGKIYAYNFSSKNRDDSKDINTLGSDGVNRSYGLWSDGTTMWVTDWEDNKIYAYNLVTKQRQ